MLTILPISLLNPLFLAQRQQSPAEKALHELDIYKTPLIPSRLRLSNETSKSTEQVASSSVPDLFKSRRTSKLVLIHDEKRSTRLGAKHVDSRKAPVVNDTKPYAGEGGMKKLLARHKYDIGVDEEQDVQDTEDKGMDDDAQVELSRKSETGKGTSATKTDWFAAASTIDRPLNTTSSLRVGRDKKRNHIARPKAKLVKPKFSAAFDEDGDDVMDDGINDEKEKAGKEEVSGNRFIFTPPPGFSFVQNVSNISYPDEPVGRHSISHNLCQTRMIHKICRSRPCLSRSRSRKIKCQAYRRRTPPFYLHPQGKRRRHFPYRYRASKRLTQSPWMSLPEYRISLQARRHFRRSWTYLYRL